MSKDDHRIPLAVEVKVPKDGSAFQNPGCYANGLNTCVSAISREHYISEGILREIEKYQSGGRIRVGGFPWATGEREVFAKALKSKILCERHNQALSPIDQVGIDFFRAFHEIDRDIQRNGESRPCYSLNGHDVERWMVKALLGLIAAGSDERIPKNWKAPIHLLEFLFDGKPLPPTCGLYVVMRQGQPPSRLSFAPLFDGTSVRGLLMEMVAASFYLFTNPIRPKHGLIADGIYRLDRFNLQSSETGKHQAIVFGWETKGEGGILNLMVAPGRGAEARPSRA